MNFNRQIKIGNKTIGLDKPSFFIADIGANHDGDLEKAKELIYMCADAGADVAKFQHFSASSIVSDEGFKKLGGKDSHQASWSKSVFEVYKGASIDLTWTTELVATCKKANIQFMTSPYSAELIEHIDPYVSAYKVGSGDIDWDWIIGEMAKKGKPMLLASGASSCDDVYKAMKAVNQYTKDIVLMQCNTNYTASLDNFKYIQLNVLKTYANMFPGAVLGLSDHTPGHSTVLGAVALGARVIEKHFTDSNEHEGPDHKFAMNPKSWAEMVERTRELELSLGTGIKRIEENELHTSIVQRRSLHLNKDIKKGQIIKVADIDVLRPAPQGALKPNDLRFAEGKIAQSDLSSGSTLKWTDIK
ncbi:N-acetylneuraminate synthase family protein [Psychrobium sp. nBUS_13]|uniref:N-acetylneuraminate synthase family protein n=1 Tax=Psychrobium sp. nBUS_13 TaxID=3395319 RepID=UPI003EC0681B